MSSPALYWAIDSERLISHQDALALAQNTMTLEGLSDISPTAVDVSGRTASTHAAIVPIKVADSPPPEGGVATTVPSARAFVFIVAGDGAKKVLDRLVDRMNSLASW